MQAIRLLLVEDDLMLVDILADALSDAGYEVIRAADGVEGAELLQKSGNIRGLITDIDLGGVPNGWELARSAREKHPQMAIVYATACGAEDWPVEGVPSSLMIPKPYAVGQIVAAIASLLNQNSLGPTTSAPSA